MTEVPEKVIVHDSGIPPMRVVYPENMAGMVCFWSKSMEPGESKPMGEFKYVQVDKAARSGRALIVRPAGYDLYYSDFLDQETARSMGSSPESSGLGGEFYFHHKGRMMLSIFRPSVKQPNASARSGAHRKSYSNPAYREWERG